MTTKILKSKRRTAGFTLIAGLGITLAISLATATLAQAQPQFDPLASPPLPASACQFEFWHWMKNPVAGYELNADGTCRPTMCPKIDWQLGQRPQMVSLCPLGKKKRPGTELRASSEHKYAFCVSEGGLGETGLPGYNSLTGYGSFFYVDPAKSPDCE
jgi:hypothetical protein